MPPISEEARQRLLGMGTRGRSAASLGGQLNERPPDNPLDSLQPTGDLQADALAELDAIMAAFVTLAATDRPLAEWMHTTRSPHWVTMVFLFRKDKNHMLLSMRLFDIGDKYVAIEDWDTAVAKLAERGPAEAEYKLWTMPTWDTNTDGEPITEQQLKFRQAAANASRNFEILGDSEYWLCVCFRTAERRAQFLQQHPPVPGTSYLDGYAVAESLGIEIPHDE